MAVRCTRSRWVECAFDKVAPLAARAARMCTVSFVNISVKKCPKRNVLNLCEKVWQLSSFFLEFSLLIDFVSAILHAMYHDGSSGGVVRIGIIDKDGIERRLFYAPIEPTVGSATDRTVIPAN